MDELKGRMTIDQGDPETIAYEMQALVLLLSEAVSGPHCQGEVELLEQDRDRLIHGQVIVLKHLSEGIETLSTLAMGNVTKMGGRNDG